MSRSRSSTKPGQRAWLLACGVVGFAGLGHVRAEDAPPGRPAATDLAPDFRDDRVQRKAIRGGPLDVSRESVELQALRAFESETFRPASSASEPSGSTPLGQMSGQTSGDSLAQALRTPLTDTAQAQPRYSAPPWLAALKLLDHFGLGPTFVRFENHVVKYLEFYKDERRGRAIMSSWLRRQGRYRKLIEQALDKYKLPRFLLYVSMIESGYDPHDRSHKGAVGLWQFLPEGARIYGLRVDYWVDERQDPVRSTEAAARYLGDLKARFGSWHLALAAFNAGYGAVLRATQKYNTNDYWELCRHEDGLPWETLLYVPKAIATALVGENRTFFGYDDTPTDAPLSFDSVTVSASVSLASAAQVVGVLPEEIARLNPHLRRGRTPPLGPGETWQLRLPLGSAPQFVVAYDHRGEKLEPYVVRFGERLEDIAKVRGVATSRLRSINGVQEAAEVRAGLILLVPPTRSVPPENSTFPTEELVVVAVPDKNLRVPNKKQVFYRVVAGDNLWSIARFFKIKDADLLRWNNLDPEATLSTKMVLSLWIDPQFDLSEVVLVDPARVRVVTVGSDEFFELVETLRGRKRHLITVNPGDTLEKIGRRFGLSVADMERINRMGRKTELVPGQTVVAYQNMTPQQKTAALRKLLPGGTDKPGETDKATVPDNPQMFGPQLPPLGPPLPSAPDAPDVNDPSPGKKTVTSPDATEASSAVSSNPEKTDSPENTQLPQAEPAPQDE